MPTIVNRDAPARAAAPVPSGPTRASLKPWDLFRTVFRSGKQGKKEYIHLGKNGKYYSLNAKNAEIASSRNGGRSVKKTGSAELKQTLFSHDRQISTYRNRLTSNDLFQVTEGGPIYAAVGVLADGRFMSINLNSRDYAVADPDRGNKSVRKVGTYTVEYKHS